MHQDIRAEEAELAISTEQGDSSLFRTWLRASAHPSITWSRFRRETQSTRRKVKPISKLDSTMSGSLVPTSASFQQQGSVDWVELSGRSVQFSVAVLARLSKAGIDPFTLQIGRAICTKFSLHPIAQGRISDAILALKKFGSYGDVIWFGFGVKHVVTDLAETEEGLTLVALCAALSTTYDALYGARVLRELCSLCKAPQLFTPAIRQWKILVELCAGILTTGHFVLVLDGFRRLVSGGRNRLMVEANRSPTTYSALAEAILTIAQVTNKKLASATFTGGLDCVWLAAVAEWIFSLDIVMYTSAGVMLYRSGSLDQQPPQITLVYLEDQKDWEEGTFVSEKTSLIRGGCTLFVHEDDSALGGAHLFNWRSSWSTILHDTFHESLDELLKGKSAYQFSLYLYCASMSYDSKSVDLVDPLLWTQESSRGHKFLTFASERLPELRDCLKRFKPKVSSIPRDNIYGRASGAMKNIEKECTAHRYQERRDACLGKLAQTILVFIWITLVSDIDPEITPSVTGLGNLYRWRDPPGGTQVQQTALVFHVLSGLFVDSEEQGLTTSPSNYLAMAGAGVCVYRQALADPNLPPDSIFRYRVVSGYITHADTVFKRIGNLSGRRNPPDFSFDALSECQSVDTLVQETDRDSELAMAYQVNYVDSRGKKRYSFLSLGRLLRNLQCHVMTFKCEGGCSDLPVKPEQDLDEPDMAQKAIAWQDTHGYPMIFFDSIGTRNAQRHVAALRGLSNLWVFALTNMERGFKHAGVRFCRVDMLISRPFTIYLYLIRFSEDALCVFPFTYCLNCMIERGCLAKVYDYFRETMPSTGHLRLMGPENNEEEISWMTLHSNYEEHPVPR